MIRIMAIFKHVFLLMLCGIAMNLYAQDAVILGAKKAFNEKKYPKVVKMAEAAIKKDKNAAEWYYLKASAEFMMSKMAKYQGGKINYAKESVKSAVKGREKDKDGQYLEEYREYFEAIVDYNNKEAIANYGQKRYSGAVQLYKKSYDLTGDTMALGMMGVCYWLDHHVAEALPVLKQVTAWNYDAFMEGNGDGTYLREPFEILSNFYLEKNYFDTAKRYTEMGLQLFPMNRVLLTNEKKMMRSQLIGLSRRGAINTKYRDIIKSALKFFPGDTFFLVQQNYYYLTKLMQATQGKPYDSADAFTNEFYNTKKDLIKSGVTNPVDEFLIADYNKFLFQCMDYFLRTNTDRTAPYFFRTWYAKEYKFAEFDEKLSESLLKNPPETISHRLISMLFSDVLEDYPWNKNIKKYRLDYFNRWMKLKIHRGELEGMLAMNDALIKDFPLDKTLKTALQTVLTRNLDSSIAYGEMYDAWTYYNRMRADFPALNVSEMQKRLAMADFNERYAGTRIYYNTVQGKKVANTGWDGKSSDCNVGYMPDSTLYSVVNRLNYFRQNAGVVLPMDLSREKSRKCQEAAVMFAPKGIFTREPSEATHTCFTKGAKEAAQIGQCILESNPAQSVTIFMDDSKSDEIVNRRAILNPEATEAGVGSAENNSVFWLLDMAGAEDSVWYQNHFVAWPAPGYSPKMLLFKKWSFSIAADLKDAKVTIKNKSSQEVAATVNEYPISGMLLRTLVIVPDINPKNAVAGDYYDVTVELKDKKKYTYRVTLF